ncbi:integrase core domain-containing protein [uncultured Maritimibacter sp.]|uniref:integrase core domain-containing protein n=1 Tax=uncultured Maritimibacter sp. TaxID=991866 RepID=UPI002594203C|nr:integrase core domain-containing protein [uncultured Maritimibacter sp.]
MAESWGSRHIVSLNSKFWAECLHICWLMSLVAARKKLETWHRHYNEDRPHSAIGAGVRFAVLCSDAVASPAIVI